MKLYYSFLKLFYRLVEGKKPSKYELEKKLARKKRPQLADTRFIGITGSGGKTTACRFLHHLLNEQQQAFLSAILNTVRHIPGRICAISKTAKYAVFEVSGNEPGAINDACAYLQPDIGIVTIVATDHFTAFRSMENVAQEKVNLVKNIQPTGVVFLNADDSLVLQMRSAASAKVMTYGQNPQADYRAINVRAAPDGRIRFTCIYQNETADFDVGLTGVHFITPIMAGIACAHYLGFSLAVLAQRAASFTQTEGRCSLHNTLQGQTFICDTEKAPYQTLPLAIDVLRIFDQAPRRTLVIGTVSDKGGTTSKRYSAVTTDKNTFVDRIIFFGDMAAHAKPTAAQIASGNVVFCKTIAELRQLIRATHTDNEVIMLKGSSKADKLERIALDHTRKVTCWVDGCKRLDNCFDCDEIDR